MIQLKTISSNLIYSMFQRLLLIIIKIIKLEICIIILSDIGMMVRVFANGPGDLNSILSQVILKT